MYLLNDRKTFIATSCGGGNRLCMCVLMWFKYIFLKPHESF